MSSVYVVKFAVSLGRHSNQISVFFLMWLQLMEEMSKNAIKEERLLYSLEHEA